MVEDLRVDGITTRIKLFSGALVLNYATVDRLIMDMEANHIQRAVVQQITPPNKNCVEVMDNIVKIMTVYIHLVRYIPLMIIFLQKLIII